MSERNVAASMDLDGVFFSRIPAQMDVLKPWNYNEPLTISNGFIAHYQRIARPGELTWHEKAEVRGHAKRKIKPEALAMLDQMDADMIIGNTGRPNNQEMVTMTEQKLEEAGVSIGEGKTFEYVLFKPPGYSSDESKYWGLQELLDEGYNNVYHYDDNAATVKRLAKQLPRVKFVIVQDLSSGILFSRAEMKQYNNVARIAVHKDNVIAVNHILPGFEELPHKITYLS
jgi:hypothetical protein